MTPFRRQFYRVLAFSEHRVDQMQLGRRFRVVGATGGIAVFQQIMQTQHRRIGNQHIIKGLIMLAAVFILLIVFTVRMYRIISAVIESGVVSTADPAMIMDRVMAEGPSALYWLFAAFCILWAYSVFDAFWGGREADRREEGGLP